MAQPQATEVGFCAFFLTDFCFVVVVKVVEFSLDNFRTLEETGDVYKRQGLDTHTHTDLYSTKHVLFNCSINIVSRERLVRWPGDITVSVREMQNLHFDTLMIKL